MTTKKCKRCYDKNLLKECACGCGGILAERDSNSRFRSFICGHHSKLEKYKRRIAPKGTNHYNWKGGKKHDGRGYIMIRIDVRKYKPEHDIIMENSIGRNLNDDEVVHHINGIKDDNRPENLQLVTKSEHTNIHHRKGESRAEFWKTHMILRDKQTGRIKSVIPHSTE